MSLQNKGEAMTKTKHSPTPWKAEPMGDPDVDPRWAIMSGNTYIAVTSQGNDETNAQLIVSAVNAHDKIVEAAKTVVETFRYNEKLANHVERPLLCPIVELEQALKLAEAQAKLVPDKKG